MKYDKYLTFTEICGTCYDQEGPEHRLYLDIGSFSVEAPDGVYPVTNLADGQPRVEVRNRSVVLDDLLAVCGELMRQDPHSCYLENIAYSSRDGITLVLGS